jgi:hypothetical protein
VTNGVICVALERAKSVYKTAFLENRSDLTVLAKKNNGVFPVNSVYENIDGRKAVIAHGTRDMAIWGDRYAPEPSRALIPRPSENILGLFYDPETVVRMRILAVIDYLNRIQEK